MSRTLPAAREVFVAAMKRETTRAELSRLVAVLDALHQNERRPSAEAHLPGRLISGILAFQCVGSKEDSSVSSHRPRQSPKIKIYPPNGRSLRAETRAKVVETLNAHARLALDRKRPTAHWLWWARERQRPGGGDDVAW